MVVDSVNYSKNIPIYKHYDIVVCGAGPAGIFTAVELIRKSGAKKIVLAEKGASVEKRRCPKAVTGTYSYAL